MTIIGFTVMMGVFYILFGLAGFAPGFLQEPHLRDPSLIINGSYGRLFGLFPVNFLHNLIHIGFGIGALLAVQKISSTVKFCRFSAVIFAALTVMGLVPGLNTLFGMVPIFGHDIWLNAVTSVTTGYFGFMASTEKDPYSASIPVSKRAIV